MYTKLRLLLDVDELHDLNSCAGPYSSNIRPTCGSIEPSTYIICTRLNMVEVNFIHAI